MRRNTWSTRRLSGWARPQTGYSAFGDTTRIGPVVDRQRALEVHLSCISGARLMYPTNSDLLERERDMQRSWPEMDYADLSNSTLIALLMERAADCGQQSMTARLTSIAGIVEVLLDRGYGRSQVRELLTEVGWRFTSNSFDSALSRIRKRQRSGVGSGPREFRDSVSKESGDPASDFAEIFASPRANWKGK